MNAVPVVSPASESTADPRIGAALVEPGFLFVEDHGVGADSWQEVFAVAARAFALPAEVKAKYRGPNDGSQRGYLGLRTETGNGLDALDRKESWHVHANGHRFANLFPEEIPEFGPCMLGLVDALETLAEWILDGIDTFLGNPSKCLANAVRGGDSLLRLNFYPESTAGETRGRFLAHRDFDLITLLLASDRSGFEVQDRNGRWIPATPSGARILVHAGDILAIESGGRIPSMLHRVVSPPRSDGGRLSMVYFVAPRRAVRLADGTLAGEFLDSRLRSAGYLR